MHCAATPSHPPAPLTILVGRSWGLLVAILYAFANAYGIIIFIWLLSHALVAATHVLRERLACRIAPPQNRAKHPPAASGSSTPHAERRACCCPRACYRRALTTVVMGTTPRWQRTGAPV